ncbi:Glucan endo-1,3-alpha-glucosidase agn1 [Aspergillus fumigatus]
MSLTLRWDIMYRIQTSWSTTLPMGRKCAKHWHAWDGAQNALGNIYPHLPLAPPPPTSATILFKIGDLFTLYNKGTVNWPQTPPSTTT